MNVDDTPFIEVARMMRRRARTAQVTSYILICLVVIVGAAAVYLFFEYSLDVRTVTVGASVSNSSISLGGDFDWLREITRAFVRIGGVLLAVFVINILVSFARYNAKIANALQTRADCLMIAGKDLAQMAAILPIVMTDAIDFTPVPQNPYDKYLDMVRGFAPSRAGKAE